MKTVIGKTVGIAIALVGLLLGSPAYADSISYTVGGWSGQFPGSVTPPAGATWGTDGYPGDTVELQTYTGTLTLASGTYYQKINTLLWTIDYTYGGTSVPWGNMDFTFDALRNMSFNGGPSGAIEQSGQLVSGWENDSLGFSDGSTVSFVVSGYRMSQVIGLTLHRLALHRWTGPTSQEIILGPNPIAMSWPNLRLPQFRMPGAL